MVADAVYIVKAEALTDAVTWVPDLPASGTYQVYAKWTANETRATDARYSILHEGGTAEVSVNQRAAGGLWQYLGSYAFDPLNTPTVSLAANDNGSVAADAVRFVGGPGGATDIAYLHADHLGTPQAMTGANAQVLWWRDQTPFGQTVAEGGFSSTPIRFPGQYEDPESGLHYNYFRDYDPALGRYIQSDPIGLHGGLNTYGYVGGNPVRYVDFDGLAPKPVPRQRARTRACTSAEYSACEAMCGSKGVESCRVSQTFRFERFKDPVTVLGWKDGPMSCSCKDPEGFCKRNPGTCMAAVGIGICILILTPWPDELAIPVIIGGGAAVTQ